MKYKLSKLQEKVVKNSENKEEQSGDEVFDRIKSMVGSGNKIVKEPRFELSPEEKYAIYDSIIEVIESGMDSEEIAKWIVKTLEEKLNDIKTEATNLEGPKGPVFKRSEQ